MSYMSPLQRINIKIEMPLAWYICGGTHDTRLVSLSFGIWWLYFWISKCKTVVCKCSRMYFVCSSIFTNSLKVPYEWACRCLFCLLIWYSSCRDENVIAADCCVMYTHGASKFPELVLLAYLIGSPVCSVTCRMWLHWNVLPRSPPICKSALALGVLVNEPMKLLILK